MCVVNLKDARKKASPFILVPATPGQALVETGGKVIVESEAVDKRRAPRGVGKEVRCAVETVNGPVAGVSVPSRLGCRLLYLLPRSGR